VHPIAISFRIDPLTDVALSVDPFPNSVAFLMALFPFTIVDLSISPGVDPNPVGFVVDEFALKIVSV
jgi:hypothetical protein